MIKHIVFFKYKPATSDAEKTRLESMLRALPAKVPGILKFFVARDIGRKPNSFDMALDSEFGSFADVESYAVHPAHVEVVEYIKTVCESTCKVDYEFQG